MYMSYGDEAFLKTLTADEQKMFVGIGEIAASYSTLNWLNKNNIHNFGNKNHSVFSYVMYPNRAVPMQSSMAAAAPLLFSNDQNLFKLKPDQPVRSAMTETEIDKPIYINLNKINDPANSLDLPAAISLLIHEVGHKLGSEKKQDAVDSLAVKMESYIRSLVSTTEVGDKKIHTLKMPGFAFQEWSETTLFGKFVKEGAARVVMPFSVIDGEGLYAWVEDANKITDLTTQIVDNVRTNSVISYTKHNYQYARQAAFIADTIAVEPLANSKFRILAQGRLGEIVVPFMNASSPDPQLFKVYENSFKAIQPWANKGCGHEYIFDDSNYKLQIGRPAAPVVALPQFQTEFLEKRLKGNNLEIFFKVPGNREFPGDPGPNGSKKKMLWPELEVQIGSSQITLPASNYYEDSEEFKFILKDFDSISKKDVKIVGVQLRLPISNLAVLNSDVIGKAMLANEIILAKSNGSENQTKTPAIKSIQIWDGQSWVSLRGRTNLQKGMHLRFVFNTNERLRELVIDQGYVTVYSTKMWLNDTPSDEEIQAMKDPNRRQLHFYEESMRQTIHNDSLYVDINIDQNVATELKVDSTEKANDWFRKYTKTTAPKSIPGLQARIEVAASEQRDLLGFKFVTASGLSNQVRLKKQIPFEKSAGSQPPDATSLPAAKPLRNAPAPQQPPKPIQAIKKPEVQRQQLFTLANDGLAFISTMALYDSAFEKTLTADEKKMLTKTTEIIQEMTTLRWLNKNKVERYKVPKGYIYAYTVFKNEVVQLSTEIDHPIELQFSKDQSLFTLSPNEPIRSAMTETNIEKDIFLNLEKINSGTETIDLATAVSLLIHEYGHKLGSEKNQDAINSAAIKLENYVRNRINTAEINGKKVNTLAFFDFSFQQWAEKIYFGDNSTETKAGQLMALTSVDKQGVYAWVEDGEKVTDLTDTLLGKSRKTDFVPYTNQPAYQFLKQHVTLANHISISEGNNQDIKISFIAHFKQLILPFMKQGSFVPKQYDLNLKAFPNAHPYIETDQTHEFTLDGQSYALKTDKIKAPTFNMPQYKIEFLEKRIKGNDLEIFYKIEGDRKLPLDPFTGKIEQLWPELTVSINGKNQLILKATNFYEDSSEFKFVIKNFKDIANNNLSVTNLMFKATGENLAMSNSNWMAKGFLPSEVKLSSKATNDTITEEASLKAIQVWDGKKWISLKKSQIHKGMHLRLIFTSSKPLRSLTLDQSYLTHISSDVWTEGHPVRSAHMLTRNETRRMDFTETDMRQTLVGRDLYVDINIDQKVLTNLTAEPTQEHDKWFRDFTGTTRQTDPELRTIFHQNTSEERTISGVTYITSSGSGQSIDLKKELSFKKPPGQQPPDNSSLQFRKMKCEYLF